MDQRDVYVIFHFICSTSQCVCECGSMGVCVYLHCHCYWHNKGKAAGAAATPTPPTEHLRKGSTRYLFNCIQFAVNC